MIEYRIPGVLFTLRRAMKVRRASDGRVGEPKGTSSECKLNSCVTRASLKEGSDVPCAVFFMSSAQRVLDSSCARSGRYNRSFMSRVKPE